MPKQAILLLFFLAVLSGCNHSLKPNTKNIQTIAFGSCNEQNSDQSFWPVILAQQPDLWIWLGDNIYADTEDMSIMAEKYQLQKTNKYYQNFSQITPITGIWDDHDYGQNDGNRTFIFKAESKQQFLNFLDTPEDNPVNQYPGIYRSETFGLPPNQVKLIHLDTRTFQDPLTKTPKGSEKNYFTQENGQLLGKAQWQWLTQELNQSTADINIIASSLQVIAEDHRYEMWANFPKQRKQLFDLVVSSQAKNPIFMSGDRHLSEISSLNWKGQKLIDITSSGLTHSFSGTEEYNRHRIGHLITTESFSTISIDWPSQQIEIRQHDMQGHILNNHLVDINH